MDRLDYQELKRRVHRLLTVSEGNWTARIVDRCLGLLILANALAVVIATVPGVATRYGPLLYGFELLSVTVFTAEYVTRVWSCTASERYADPLFGRLRFSLRPLVVIDLVSILPFYLGALAFGFDLRVLRALRLVRFLRVVKIVRYTESVARFRRVYRRKRDDLVLALVSSVVLLLVASSLMYFAEHGAQPRKFSSIPAALWWGVVTLTTVGYGDVYPVTPLGKLLGGTIAALGVGLFALPASVLASGFLEDGDGESDAGGGGREQRGSRERRRNRNRDPERERCPHCGEPFGESTNW